MLLVFCDGTGEDGLISSNGDGKAAKNDQYATNIFRLSRAVNLKKKLPDGSEVDQIIYYTAGVGSESDFRGVSLTEGAAMKSFGMAVASKIRDVYAFIAQNHAPGDEICIFGFSRGAYTARKVAGLINRIGLLRRDQFGSFYSIWASLITGKNPPPYPKEPVPIRCVGVWDTVGSVYEGLGTVMDALCIKDQTLTPNIELALHAVSLQENRQKFLPTLWAPGPEGLCPNQVLKQHWFPGAHSNVGGGYQRSELADLPLIWMAGEICDFISLDLDFIQKNLQRFPNAGWGQSQPNNSYTESGVAVRFVVGCANRLDGGILTHDSVLHSSIEVAPTKLKEPTGMITLEHIKKKFGPAWKPKYAPLNAFEERCKTAWGKPLTAEKRTSHKGPAFENINDLFDGIWVDEPENAQEAPGHVETKPEASAGPTTLVADIAGDAKGSQIRKVL
ncbi:hypothetical protein BOTBODRAFT_66638 [Botryobasidium botryosum FD-172 SS1]|uniref:T6SS Phospholipase effector Tle1-like catalytic domain-containing protein n=1 Tax=Botryobasidium botryosum (strain FD-172 SS1) TaxID=930990 RepID=A0A067MQ28_BOTB1|nr:hypothetical protein BOTBODRAFT_66638 [Botryobasidium botryosum FD-172 SS1]